MVMNAHTCEPSATVFRLSPTLVEGDSHRIALGMKVIDEEASSAFTFKAKAETKNMKTRKRIYLNN